MYGIKALLIFIGFAFVASVFLSALVGEWKGRTQGHGGLLRLIGITAFILLWFLGMSSVYVRKAFFLYELSTLNATEVYSVQIGRHDFRDYTTIEELTGALRHSRWFEVNHGGWGTSIPLTVRRRSKADLVIDVALYFREPAAIVGPANTQGLGYSTTCVFAPELLQVLERHAVMLPDCDSAHHLPCTAEQLNP
ncbi:MAG TPA: hypothetical protein VGZ91_18915 [Candidatus Sulfotelmatobacter sp.]|jgi:hypothetical protein|nr:hypothetical protein [Candidatus Sulfotelmatobacter sp.]